MAAADVDADCVGLRVLSRHATGTFFRLWETCKNKVGNSSNYSERSWLSVESVEYYSTQNRHITPKTLPKRRVIVLGERSGFGWSITPPKTDTLPLKHYQKGVS
jgi:hypothetical protein